jgi:uncharacterized protein YprB with RNaseH-like and TPR domain
MFRKPPAQSYVPNSTPAIMGDLKPVAFDIETSGFDSDSVITVAGLAHQLGEFLIVNTDGQRVDQTDLNRAMEAHSGQHLDLAVCPSEQALLGTLREIGEDHLDGDRHYLTAFNGETWNGGFDLPFVRTACVSNDVAWPFPDMAYADMFDIVDRFNTDDVCDLVGVYDQLIGEETCDPFDKSSEAVDAFENGDWESLLCHNLADIRRTRELAVLAGEYVAQSDFRMKNLNPPDS